MLSIVQSNTLVCVVVTPINHWVTLSPGRSCWGRAVQEPSDGFVVLITLSHLRARPGAGLVLPFALGAQGLRHLCRHQLLQATPTHGFFPAYPSKYVSVNPICSHIE